MNLAAVPPFAADQKNIFRFTVHGRPQPQGSAKAFYVKQLGRAVITSDNVKMKPWRQEITGSAMMLGHVPEGQFQGAQKVTLRFYFAKPASAKKRIHMTVKPDADKLTRAVFDALSGVLFRDDAQIVDFHAQKFYGLPERVEIEVEGL